ncbi:MAG TPA: adenylate/guanylate cyclase domain-containing protein [Solirubrobacteraceae bacterium]|jgi:class 3 adenylate cyclase
MATVTRYARTRDGLHIAYRTLGAGPLDLLYVPGTFTQVEHLFAHPTVARYFERLATFGRLILFDRRECGMSDRVGRPSTLEEQADDVVAVLDAVGSERAAVLGLLEGTPMAMLFAAAHPERAGALVLDSPFARTTRAPGYEWAPKAEERAERFGRMFETWGDGSLIDGFAPAADPDLRDWLGKLQRLAMSPGTARMIHAANQDLDVRHVLPTIRVPTLVFVREGAPALDARHVRYVAEHIPGARLVALPGDDAFPFVEESETTLGEIEEFLTGARASAPTDRVLATVMFTDICGSTEVASELGDRRWRDKLAAHDAAIRGVLARHGGREVKTVGDGVLATFDGPARGIRAGRAIAAAVRALGLEVRVGLHTGETEVIGADVGGLAVHIAARVMALAQPSEILVSQTVKDLVTGSGMRFADRGQHALRGVPGEWRVWAVAG